MTFKMPELNVTTHIFAPIHITTKKSNNDVICGRDLLRELGIQLELHKMARYQSPYEINKL